MSHLRVLIADDHADSRDLYAHAFEHLGFEVETASDGEAAMTAAKVRVPDVLLLDVRMPKVDGIEVIRHLRSDPQTAGIVAIATSGDAYRREDAFAAGFDDFCLKPCPPNELVLRILQIALPLAAASGRPLRERAREVH